MEIDSNELNSIRGLDVLFVEPPSSAFLIDNKLIFVFDRRPQTKIGLDKVMNILKQKESVRELLKKYGVGKYEILFTVKTEEPKINITNRSIRKVYSLIRNIDAIKKNIEKVDRSIEDNRKELDELYAYLTKIVDKEQIKLILTIYEKSNNEIVSKLSSKIFNELFEDSNIYELFNQIDEKIATEILNELKKYIIIEEEDDPVKTLRKLMSERIDVLKFVEKYMSNSKKKKRR